MPVYVVPWLLHNLIPAFHEKLPAAARGAFHQQFFQRLELLPHPEQPKEDTTEGVDLYPALEGTTHLDAIARWTFLGMLVDPDFGVLNQARMPLERAKVLEAAILYRRWLEDDYPSESEWAAVFESEHNLPEEQWTKPYAAGCCLGWVGKGEPFFISMVADQAACSYENQSLGWPPGSPLASASLLSRLLDGSINLVVKLLGRGPIRDPHANPRHYLWQASWLLDLMNLRWLPADPREQELFQSLLQGGIFPVLGDYALQLRKNKVDLDLIPRMENTLKRMYELRQRAVPNE